ncbi:hypothetical protein [Amycolatopsis sp. DG1A-15b]|uniref:AAA family ATPase n=1 Tax=Amycolatopsis sp. DG1A-15b TaxID=3052846 RepID=UPI00255BDA70|nr:hypothetical protein [Amycolatopsis sp. DG1A-15b]WIX92148.1 hypothetical protein QRY02_17550 [Amycolatopsis sp. DG1A-15b]
MLLGLVRPTRGQVRLFGEQAGPGRNAVWAQVGYLVETPSAYPELTVTENRPELLILDEPANGLDPAGVAEIRNLLHDLAHHDGVTILLSSHILTEVARLAGRVACSTADGWPGKAALPT